MTELNLPERSSDTLPQPRRRRRDPDVPGLADVLAARVRDGRYIGMLRPGDRLPSIREVAREFEVDHRAVSAAYRELAHRGLVEIRGRAGVFATAVGGPAEATPVSEAAWVADVVAGAWERGVGLQELVSLVQRGYDGSGFVAAFVESNADQLAGACDDLRKGFGLRAVPVRLQPGDVAPSTAAPAAIRLREDLAEVDLVCTTTDHYDFVEPIARALRKPIVRVMLDPLGMERTYQLLGGGGLTVLVADPAFEDRLRRSFRRSGAELAPDAIVHAGDAAAVATLDRRRTIVATRAAHRMVKGCGINCLVPHHPVLAVQTTRELVAALCALKSALDSASNHP